MTVSTLRAPARLFAPVFVALRWGAAMAGVFVGALMVAAFGPGLFGAGAMIITSGSMEPTLPIGSVAVTKPIDPGEVAVGDIVTFRHEGADLPFTHRVTQISREDGRWVFTTKGDANHAADPLPLIVTDRIDRVERSVPIVGYVVGFARTPWGALLLLAVPAVGLTVDQRRSKHEARPDRCPHCGAARE